MAICSEFLKEEYYEGFTVLLTVMAYDEQDTTMNFIQSTMNWTLLR
jgi:hypothetical protein